MWGKWKKEGNGWEGLEKGRTIAVQGARSLLYVFVSVYILDIGEFSLSSFFFSGFLFIYSAFSSLSCLSYFRFCFFRISFFSPYFGLLSVQWDKGRECQWEGEEK